MSGGGQVSVFVVMRPHRHRQGSEVHASIGRLRSHALSSPFTWRRTFSACSTRTLKMREMLGPSSFDNNRMPIGVQADTRKLSKKPHEGKMGQAADSDDMAALMR
ncbi:hypothetical protein An14g01650 [Aspergillus niger]|uniref:Uncharacterized protein n=2 Tax=Aspergillus niger TaxID=5061 RepID=A2R2R1_ASPNC|nr:hypothetical protein An14g01650 [Aspergillus niger]CAK46477.1 hypothetical protein An14g01650 [Aspergillus niger]